MVAAVHEELVRFDVWLARQAEEEGAGEAKPVLLSALHARLQPWTDMFLFMQRVLRPLDAQAAKSFSEAERAAVTTTASGPSTTRRLTGQLLSRLYTALQEDVLLADSLTGRARDWCVRTLQVCCEEYMTILRVWTSLGEHRDPRKELYIFRTDMSTRPSKTLMAALPHAPLVLGRDWNMDVEAVPVFLRQDMELMFYTGLEVLLARQFHEHKQQETVTEQHDHLQYIEGAGAGTSPQHGVPETKEAKEAQGTCMVKESGGVATQAAAATSPLATLEWHWLDHNRAVCEHARRACLHTFFATLGVEDQLDALAAVFLRGSYDLWASFQPHWVEAARHRVFQFPHEHMYMPSSTVVPAHTQQEHRRLAPESFLQLSARFRESVFNALPQRQAKVYEFARVVFRSDARDDADIDGVGDDDPLHDSMSSPAATSAVAAAPPPHTTSALEREFAKTDLNALQSMEVELHVPWPINEVFNNTVIRAYSRVLQFLSQLEFTAVEAASLHVDFLHAHRPGALDFYHHDGMAQQPTAEHVHSLQRVQQHLRHLVPQVATISHIVSALNTSTHMRLHYSVYPWFKEQLRTRTHCIKDLLDVHNVFLQRLDKEVLFLYPQIFDVLQAALRCVALTRLLLCTSAYIAVCPDETGRREYIAEHFDADDAPPAEVMQVLEEQTENAKQRFMSCTTRLVTVLREMDTMHLSSLAGGLLTQLDNTGFFQANNVS